MKERLRESLSALMDDAADDLELARVLRAMDEDDNEVSATWSRYHLISAVLNGTDVDGHGSVTTLAIDIEDEVVSVAGDVNDAMIAADSAGAAIDQNDAPPARLATPAWKSFAAAASVTLALSLVIGFQWQTQGSDAPVVAAVRDDGPVRTDSRALFNASEGGAAQGVLSGPLVMPSRFGSAPSRATGDAQRQVDAYMLYHAEFTAVNSDSGIMPFARYAAFEGGR